MTLEFISLGELYGVKVWGAIHAGMSFVITKDDAHGFAASVKGPGRKKKYLALHMETFDQARKSCEEAARKGVN